MRLNVDAVLCEILIQVFLQILEAKCVAIFKLAVCVTIYLQTLVCQVHVVVFVAQVVLGGTSTQIPRVVNINLVIVCDQSPNTNVKLPTVPQKWLFNVFLDDPKHILRVLLENKFTDVSHVTEQFDAASLVEGSWFN